MILLESKKKINNKLTKDLNNNVTNFLGINISILIGIKKNICVGWNLWNNYLLFCNVTSD